MSKYLTKKRREVEKELLMYLRNYRFFFSAIQPQKRIRQANK